MVKFEVNCVFNEKSPSSTLKKMSEAPQHFIIQMDRLPQKSPADPLPCAVCIVHDAHQDGPSAVSRAIPGTIRCETHQMRCATCRGYVQEDSHLCCHSCWAFDRLKRLVHEGTVEALLIEGRVINSAQHHWVEGRICRYHQTPLTQSQQSACNCLRCKRMLAAAVEARALEEGQADRLSPPSSCESPHVAVSFALDRIG